jgi:plastocyanin
MSKTKRALTAGLLTTVFLMIAAVVAACGGGSSEKAQSAPSTPTGPPAATITIDNFMFGSPVSVPAGATIEVKNADPAEHSVTADSGDAFNVEVADGGTATFTAPSKPGSYPYHCSYHPMMHGTLVVK